MNCNGNVNNNSIKGIWQSNLEKIRDLNLQEKYKKTPIYEECKDWDSYMLTPFLEKKEL